MKRTVSLILALLVVASFASAQQAKTAPLRIMCNVSGAQVFLAGQLIGNTTPNLVVNVRYGNFPIKIVKKGYSDFDTTVNIGPGGATVRVELVPRGQAPNAMPAPGPGAMGKNAPIDNSPVEGAMSKNAPGPNTIAVPRIQNYDLSVSSNVNGADVYINGNPAGKTPFVAQVPEGSYTVLVRCPGYIDFTQNIVVNNRAFQVNAMLQAQTQQLSVQSNVNGAEVLINGNSAGRTPFVAQLPTGTYSVRVRASGYVDFIQDVIVGNGPAQINVALQVQTQQLNVQSNVNGAEVLINGNSAGKTPFIAQLPMGSYSVRVRAPGYTDFLQDVVVGVNGPAIVNASLQLATASWQLQIPESFTNKDKDQRRNLQLWVDGALQNGFAGLLLPGKHVIRLISGGLVVETQVEVQAGRAYIFEPFLGINVK